VPNQEFWFSTRNAKLFLSIKGRISLVSRRSPFRPRARFLRAVDSSTTDFCESTAFKAKSPAQLPFQSSVPKV
jgi:hypothetical protein